MQRSVLILIGIFVIVATSASVWSETKPSCPEIMVRSRLDLKQNTAVTIAVTSIVSGGIPPYTITFYRIPEDCSRYALGSPSHVLCTQRNKAPQIFPTSLPNGLHQGSGATFIYGTPTTIGIYQKGIEVMDSCPIAQNQATGKVTMNSVKRPFTIQVTDPTPPTLSGLSITPSTLPSTGGDVVFKVTASDNKAVTVVNATVSRPSIVEMLALKRVSGTEKSGVWQGTYKAAPNTTSKDVSYMVNCTAVDSDGNKSYSYKGGPVFVVKGKPAGSTIPSKPKGPAIQ